VLHTPALRAARRLLDEMLDEALALAPAVHVMTVHPVCEERMAHAGGPCTHLEGASAPLLAGWLARADHCVSACLVVDGRAPPARSVACRRLAARGRRPVCAARRGERPSHTMHRCDTRASAYRRCIVATQRLHVTQVIGRCTAWVEGEWAWRDNASICVPPDGSITFSMRPPKRRYAWRSMACVAW
jgi:hypothetical protein